MPAVSEVQKRKRSRRDFSVKGDIAGILGENGIVLQGSDSKLLTLQGRNVSFQIVPDAQGVVRIGESGSRLTAIDHWRVPADRPATIVSVNIV